MSSLREVAEAARDAHDRMMEIGEGVGALTRSERDALDDYDEMFGPDSPTVLALLGVVVAASEGCGCPVAAPHRRTCRVTAALARLPEEVRDAV